MTVLWVIEDDDSIRNGLVRSLTADGFEVAASSTVAGVGALAGTPDIVLLDVNLPDGDGFDLCRSLATGFPASHIIMLTARVNELDVVVGLDSGAVDYVTKPFRLAELKARIRAHMRTANVTVPTTVDGVFSAGDVRINARSRRVWFKDVELTLRAKEFDLLLRLMTEPGQVVTRETLMRDVWDEHWFGSTKTLDVHIAALRRRFGESSEHGSHISTVRGVGFRFEPPQ